MGIWNIITSEYPPQPGGVSDYTCHLAAGLAAAGEEVHVWCPPASEPPIKPQRGVSTHRELGRFGIQDLWRIDKQLNRSQGPRRLLVQWVPHGYGCHSMNVPFCFWLWSRSLRRGDHIEIMVHEPFLTFGEGSWRQNLPALVHRLMTLVLLRAAQKVYVSIPAWERLWRPYALGRPTGFQWLPIPSNIPIVSNPAGVAAVRRRYAPQETLLIGHFGTYGAAVSPLLEPVLQDLASNIKSRTILLIGIGSEAFRDRLVAEVPELAHQIHATGALNPEDLSCHIAACDLLIQLYIDGVSSRRTSMMVGLSHGKPVLTTSGSSTEPIWADTQAVALAKAGDTAAFVEQLDELCNDPGKRDRLGLAARRLYESRFDLSYTITELIGARAQEHACAF